MFNVTLPLYARVSRFTVLTYFNHDFNPLPRPWARRSRMSFVEDEVVAVEPSMWDVASRGTARNVHWRKGLRSAQTTIHTRHTTEQRRREALSKRGRFFIRGAHHATLERRAESGAARHEQRNPASAGGLLSTWPLTPQMARRCTTS